MLTMSFTPSQLPSLRSFLDTSLADCIRTSLLKLHIITDSHYTGLASGVCKWHVLTIADSGADNDNGAMASEALVNAKSLCQEP